MRDRILEIIVSCATNADRGPDAPQIPITVCVGGLLVSGVIISQEAYMQFFVGGAIPQIVEKAKADGRLDPSATFEDDADEYLHLALAKFWPSDRRPVPSDGDGVLWRCRIDRIDGFHMGELAERNGSDQSEGVA